METSLMTESVVDDADVEETVTQEHVEIQLGYDQGSLSTIFSVAHCVMFSARQARFFYFSGAAGPIFFYFFGAAGPIFCFLPVLTFCLAYYQP
jgi:hypothetical protein